MRETPEMVAERSTEVEPNESAHDRTARHIVDLLHGRESAEIHDMHSTTVRQLLCDDGYETSDGEVDGRGRDALTLRDDGTEFFKFTDTYDAHYFSDK